MKEHMNNPEKQRHHFTHFHVIFDDIFNKSVILDYEQKLIKLFVADKKYIVTNRNDGQSSAHDYYDRAGGYTNHFTEIWGTLKDMGFVKRELNSLENLNLFKYSPYTALNEEQDGICTNLIEDFLERIEKDPDNPMGISLIKGGAGTGKTVLAISLVNSLMKAETIDEGSLESDELESAKVKVLLRLKKHILSSQGHPLKIGLVFPMPNIRNTIERVFRESAGGLSAKMVLSPFDLRPNIKYDILIVDESHRLFRCKNIQNYTRFRNRNESFGLDRDNATQLDWVLKQSAYTVLFYDENQSIKGSDITYDQFNATIRNSGKNLKQFELSSQIRCKGGDDYVAYLKKIMECNDELKFRDISNYRFLLYDDVDAMVRKIRELDDNEGLCRTVAGFSWEWRTRPNHIDDNTYQNLVNEGRYDIAIGDYHYIWNLSQDDWMGQTDSKYTIGCIHTVQGFDLNYVGIIFGREIDYDPNRKSLVIDLDMFCDRYVKQNADTNIVKDYILNTYMTMMTRGIKGCFVYAYNENLRNYLKSLIRAAQKPDDYPSK